MPVKRARWTKEDQFTFECEVNSGNYKGGRVGRMRSQFLAGSLEETKMIMPQLPAHIRPALKVSVSLPESVLSWVRPMAHHRFYFQNVVWVVNRDVGVPLHFAFGIAMEARETVTVQYGNLIHFEHVFSKMRK